MYLRPEATVRIASRRSFASPAFGKKPLAPARSRFTAYCSSACMLTIRIGSSGRRRRSVATVSTTEASGSEISSMTMSNPSAIASSSAEAAVPASPPTSRSAVRSMSCLKPARTSAWSSTTRTRFLRVRTASMRGSWRAALNGLDVSILDLPRDWSNLRAPALRREPLVVPYVACLAWQRIQRSSGAVRMQSVVQSFEADAQHVRRLRLAAVEGAQRGHDQRPLRVVERRPDADADLVAGSDVGSRRRDRRRHRGDEFGAGIDVHFRVGEHIRAMDDVLELAHIARPAIGGDRLPRLGGECLPAAVLVVQAFEEHLRQQRHIVTALAQRRH